MDPVLDSKLFRPPSNVCLYYQVQMCGHLMNYLRCRHSRGYVFIRNVVAENTMHFTAFCLDIVAGKFK